MNAEARPQITVLVPVLNEEQTIGEIVDRVLALPATVELIVVDDGSTDGTAAVLSRYGDRIQVLRNPERTGKGNAIRKALPFATGTVTVIQDADLEYRPEEIPSLAEPILEGTVNVVYGTRFLHGLHPGMALPNKVVNRMLRSVVKLLFGAKLTDEATCYKAVKTDLLRSLELQCERFEFCPEVTAKVLRLGETIVEIPISYEPRTIAAGKKIRWTDGVEAFSTLWKYRRWRPTRK